MVLIFSSLLLVANTVNEVHTELQVEATRPPDRAAELAAEISRAQAEIKEARGVAKSLPDGASKREEEARLTELEIQVKQMQALVSKLPKPKVKAAPQPALQAPPSSPAPPAAPPSTVWLALGFGLMVGAFLAMALVFRSLPGALPPGATRVPHLALVTALLVAVGPQLQRLGYDQLPIVMGWIILSVGVVMRLGLRRIRSQMEAFALDRQRRGSVGDDDE